ncbi:hypothetical protein [Nocardiopsis sp. YSL2]|uniref:hypothetical protein n=1 Tax=Nocardiopsis sp. YSL2 TaxID=2939492 RepID=UPI0026F43196|nr:hypothetical protein [Nocardiopsis sp. YSL2]
MDAVASTGADFLIRAKTHRTALKLPVLHSLPDGTFWSRIGATPVRVIEATITTASAEGTNEPTTYRLVTSLLDPQEAPVAALVRLHHEPWAIEISYCELKSTVLGGRVLRGRYPAAVIQQTWALVITYQALRTAMSDAVLHRPDTDPDRGGFAIALNAARDQVIRAQGITVPGRVDLVGRIGAAVLSGLLPARRDRSRPRVRKRAISSKYRAVGRGIDHRTHRSVVRIEINALPKPPDDQPNGIGTRPRPSGACRARHGPGGSPPPPGRRHRDGARSCSAGSFAASGAGVSAAAGRAAVTRRLL